MTVPWVFLGCLASAFRAAQFQLPHRAVYNRFHGFVDRDCDHVLASLRRLQRVELARQQAGRHEVPLTLREASGDQLLRAPQEDEADVVASAQEHVPISMLQRRAGDDDVLALVTDPRDLVGNSVEPGPAVLVGEGMAGPHLLDIAGGMKAVAVLETPAEALAERFCNRALARARHAHHDQCTRCFNARHEFPPGSAAWSTSQMVSPFERARTAGRVSPLSRRVKIGCLSCPAISNSISRQDASAGRLSETRGTKGATLALGTPTTQRSVSSIAG